MKTLHATIALLLLALPASGLCAEKKIKLNMPQATVEMIRSLYQTLSGKTVSLATPDLAGIPITVDAGDALLTTGQGIRFVEAALYLKGIEVVPNGENAVIFSRFAVIAPPPVRRRIIAPSQEEQDRTKQTP